MNKHKRREIFERLRAADPNPTTELEHETPFQLLVSVILSAQATDKGVNKATARLFPAANTPEAIQALGTEGLKEYIKTIGLFNSKADNILKTCRILLEAHGGEVPRTREELEKLPGVGRKSAQRLAFLWEEAAPQEPLEFAPTSAYHQDYYLVRERSAPQAAGGGAVGRLMPADRG